MIYNVNQWLSINKVIMNSSFGERLFGLLREKGISVADIAEQLGVSRQAIYKWKRDGGISDEKTQGIARLLGVSSAWLRFGNEAHLPAELDLSTSTWSTVRNELIERVIKSEQRLRVTLNAAKVTTWEYNLLTEQFTLGEEFLQYFDIAPPNLQCSRDNFLGIIHPGDRDRYNTTLEMLLLDVDDDQQEIRLLKADSSVVWANAWTIRYEDSNHRTIGLIGAFQNITKRKLAETELKHSQLCLMEAQRIAQLGSWEWLIAEDKLLWSDEVYRIFGVSRQSFQPSYDTFMACIHPSDREAVNNAVKLALKEHHDYQIEHRLIRSDGSMAYVQENGVVYFGDDGLPQRMLGTVLDITQRKNDELALIESERRLQQISEQLTIGIGVTNSKGTVLDCNPYGAKLLGYESPTHIIGKSTLPHYLRKEDREQLIKQLKKGAISNYELRLKKLNGKAFWASISASMIRESGKEQIFLSMADITRKKQTEQAIIKSEQRYHALFELGSHAVFYETLEGEILDCNQRACQLFGYSQEELIGMHVKDLIPPEIAAQLDDVITQELLDGGVMLKVEQLRKDGSRFLADVMTSLVPDGDKQGVMVTVTELQ
jgi:PAS domain S-box-containing protein